MNRKPRCLWLTGWSADETVWEPVIERLPEAEHQILSFHNKFFDVEEIHRLIRVSAPFMLIGWSMGALLALQYAAAYSRQVTEIFAVSGTSQFIRQKRDLRVLERMMREVARDPKRVLREFDQRLFTVAEEERSNAECPRIRRHLPEPDVLLAGLRYLKGYSIIEQVNRLELPIHLLSGAEDQICPVEGAESLHRLLPQSDLTVWPDAGHAPFLCQPDRFVAWMKERCSFD
ncbi:alpha/beta fold hydrolase [Laceyella putida]|uniref:Alpha/beta fold hydrolase n=1 Tax=Laceyella putida TaxID=110101 RepID=A0ABW2RFZ1_9BACL